MTVIYPSTNWSRQCKSMRINKAMVLNKLRGKKYFKVVSCVKCGLEIKKNDDETLTTDSPN